MSARRDRVADINLLYNLSNSFNAVLDLPELLRRIVEAAITLTGATNGRASLVDQDTGQFATYQIDDQGGRMDTLTGDEAYDPLVTYVIGQEKTLQIAPGDSLRNFGIDEDARNGQLYVPLTLKDRTLGVLVMTGDSSPDTFTQEDRELLAALAGYAAIAVENALLYKQAVDRSFELSLLVESANSISSSLDMGQVLNAIARHLMRALHAHWCVISSWNKNSQCLRRLAEYRSAYWQEGGGPRLALEDYPVHELALRTMKPQMAYLHDEDDGDPMQDSLRRLACSRLLVLPLQVEGRTVGLAQLCNLHNRDAFTLSEIGHSLRTTLDIAPLIEDGDAENRRAQLNEMARSLCTIAGTNWCTLYVVDGQTLDPVIAVGTGIWYESASPEQDIRQLPTLRIVLREQRIAVLRENDSHLPAAERELFETVGSSAMLALPLVFRAGTVGLVQLYDLDAERLFSGRELGLARALSNQAAVALENAHLVRDLQRSFEELQSMQGHLVRSARLTALGELSAVVAHQINNPLTTILGDAEMLVVDLPPNKPEHASAQAILRAGQRAKHVVERILTMARGEDEARPQDVNQTIAEMLEFVGQQIRQTGIDLDLHLGKDLPRAMVSPGPLGDVWMNLLMNARDAIVQSRSSHGKIVISSQLRADENLIEVIVADNGGGITPEHLERVFDPFYTTKPHGKGTGLGLYICRQIINDHHGEIQISSTPGEGTTVSVRLPVYRKDEVKA